MATKQIERFKLFECGSSPVAGRKLYTLITGKDEFGNKVDVPRTPIAPMELLREIVKKNGNPFSAPGTIYGVPEHINTSSLIVRCPDSGDVVIGNYHNSD